MSEDKQREIWVDNVKVFACILVTLGHFFQSIVMSGILQESSLYLWFNQTIYLFHVPLFFICSGYLYQKMSRVESMETWRRNIVKKAMSLGVPYLSFSFVTWLLKTVFSDQVNDEIGGLLDILLIHPIAPYWFLYALFFAFLITPTFRNSRMAAAGLLLAAALKVLGIVRGSNIVAVAYIMTYEIWFVIGMSICYFKINRLYSTLKYSSAILMGIVFILASILKFEYGKNNRYMDFALGLIACTAVVLFAGKFFLKKSQPKALSVLTRNLMPIFLMHTLFAAPIRILLMKLGIYNVAVHILLGLIASFLGPIIAAWIMKKSKWMEFFIYTGKFIHIH